MTKEKVYEHIKRSLIQRISGGELIPGDRVPSEYELVEEFKVSRNQTRQALRELELEGWLVRQQGKGTFVAEKPGAADGLGIRLGQKTVAIAFPVYNSAYGRRLMEGMMRALADNGYQAVIYNLRMDDESEFRFLTDIQVSGVDGLILWPQHCGERIRQLMKLAAERDFPLVLVDRYLPGVDVDFVVTDNEDLGYRLTKVLLDRGHKRVCFAGENDRITSIEERFEGYLRAMQEAGIEPDSSWRIAVHSGVVDESGLHALLAHKDPPPAFFCLHDATAVCLRDALKKLGYEVPQDIELSSTDDDHFASDGNCAVATLEQDAQAMGRQSAELLLARIRESGRTLEQRFLPASELKIYGM